MARVGALITPFVAQVHSAKQLLTTVYMVVVISNYYLTQDDMLYEACLTLFLFVPFPFKFIHVKCFMFLKLEDLCVVLSLYLPPTPSLYH